MKKIVSLFALALLLLVSCSDNDDKLQVAPIPTSAGTYTVNGVSSNLVKGYIIKPYTGENPDYDKRRFYVVLTDGDISMVDNDLVFADNVHSLVDFNLYTAQDAPGTVQNTTYNLYIPDSGFDMGNPFIDHSGIGFNMVFQNGQFVAGQEIDSDDMDTGHVTLANNNGIYALSFGFSSDASTSSGTFNGPLTELNYPY